MTEEEYREVVEKIGPHLDAIASVVREKATGDGSIICWFHKDGGYSFDGASLFDGWEYKNYGEPKLVHTVPLEKKEVAV